MMKISCVLLAAGDSSRMGGKNKLMLEVQGTSLIRRTLQEINKIPFHEVLVVTGYQQSQITSELEGLSFRQIHNPVYQSGMHSSIKVALQNLNPETEAFFICLADQPYFEHTNLQKLINHFADKITVPEFQGKRGNPVLIPVRFVPEILNEPDGDYGCSYLLKRHLQDVQLVPVESSGILSDIDSPEDYAQLLNKELDVRDPVEDFFTTTLELRKEQSPFAIASVIEVMGSASARTGSKAIFTNDGKNVFGWVGGGCAERFIGEQAVEAMKEGKPRTVLTDLDDEIFGLGVACGGKMKVFIDPILPAETVTLPHTPHFQNELRSLAGFYGWNIRRDNSLKSPETLKELLLGMANIVADQRSRRFESLRVVKKAPARFLKPANIRTKEVTIVGRTRITEALARHFTLLNYDIRAIGPDLRSEDYPGNVHCHCLEDSYSSIEFRRGEIVIIAGHTSRDAELVRKALESHSSYVGMIGSLKRSHEVLGHLNLIDKEVSEPLFIPAGLDIDAKNPDEIALSVIAEVISLSEGHP